MTEDEAVAALKALVEPLGFSLARIPRDGVHLVTHAGGTRRLTVTEYTDPSPSRRTRTTTFEDSSGEWQLERSGFSW